MDRLPDEILLMIFMLLPQSQVIFVYPRVCRRWAAVAERQALAVHRTCDEKRIHSGLRALYLGKAFYACSETLIAVTRIATNLRYLTVHATSPFSDDDFMALTILPNLYHLDVFCRTTQINASVLPLMRQLGSFVANETIGRGLLRRIASLQLQHLEALHMFGRSLHYPGHELLMMLCVQIDHLCELTLRCTELDDRIYAAIGSCKKLSSLQLYSCWRMTRLGAASVAQPRLLRRLHVTGARMVRINSLLLMIELLPGGIEELVLSAMWFGDEHVEALIRRLPNLRVVELWRCRLTVAGALRLAAGLRQLRVLDLDLTLTLDNIRKLATHPSLKMVRCQPEDAIDLCAFFVTNDLVPDKKVCFNSVKTSYSGNYFRQDKGEGFRASLFYHWSQDIDVEPIPSHMLPTI